MRELPWEARYVVWSHEHGAWWRGDPGYTRELDKAGRFSRVEALNICNALPGQWAPGKLLSEIPVREDDLVAVLTKEESGASRVKAARPA
jgi:hypothetical protein